MDDEKLNSVLEKCRVTTANSTDSTIAEALLPFGYTAERLTEGVTLYNETSLAFQIQKKEYTDQYYAVSVFLSAFDKARKTLKNCLKIARIAFADNVEGLRLIPVNLKIQAYSEFKTAATNFYRTVLDTQNLMSALQKYGYTSEQLEVELVALTQLELLSQNRYLEEGEAQTATENRNKKLEELRKYCSDLRVVAKIALADKPQQLEKLGIVVGNGKPKKAAANTVPVPQPTE
jgi:hypothetical protein